MQSYMMHIKISTVLRDCSCDQIDIILLCMSSSHNSLCYNVIHSTFACGWDRIAEGDRVFQWVLRHRINLTPTTTTSEEHSFYPCGGGWGGRSHTDTFNVFCLLAFQSFCPLYLHLSTKTAGIPVHLIQQS